MLTIADFKKPTKHPFGMLRGMTHAYEAESFMAWFLDQCIEADDINTEVKTRNNEDHRVVRGLLVKTKLRDTYCLSQKTKCLLYAHYGKEVTDASENNHGT